MCTRGPQVVYDPSVLVRCELAVLYSRFVRGHAPRMQVRNSGLVARLRVFCPCVPASS